MRKKKRFLNVFNKHGKIRFDRKFELMGLLNNLMKNYDDEYIFKFINYNRVLYKEETDYLSEIYNSRIK